MALARPFFVLCALALAAPALALAATPVTLVQSGYLIDTADKPVTQLGATLSFSVWTDPTATLGSARVWPATGESECTTDIKNGFYAVALEGAGTACGGGLSAEAMDSADPRFLQISIGGTVLTPRLRVGTVPTAALAQTSKDTQALIAKLAGAGTVNAETNPVDWRQLKNVPAALADGTDDGATYDADEATITLVGSTFGVKAGGIGATQLAADRGAFAKLSGGTVLLDTLGNLSLTGDVTGKSFSGSGAGLTNLSSAALNGALPAGVVTASNLLTTSAAASTYATTASLSAYATTSALSAYATTASVASNAKRQASPSTSVAPGASFELAHNFGAIDYLAQGLVKIGARYVPIEQAALLGGDTVLFSDSFARADGNTIGNGWVETIAGSNYGTETDATAARLVSGKAVTSGGVGDARETALTRVITNHAAKHLQLTWQFKETGGNNDLFDLNVRRPTTGAFALAAQGYGLRITVGASSGTVSLRDAGAALLPDVTVPGLSPNVLFNAELIARPDGSLEGRVWAASGARPSSPTVFVGPRTVTTTGDGLGIESITGETSFFEVREIQPPTNRVLFTDNFTRADSNTAGTGWIETVTNGSSFGNETGSAVRIASNRLVTGGGLGGTPETAATIVVPNHDKFDLLLNWKFKNTGGNGDAFQLTTRRPTTGTYSVLGHGYGVQITVGSPNGTVCIVDGASCVSSSANPPGLTTGVEAQVELIVRRDGSADARVWLATGVRPSTPTVSVAARSVSSSGSGIGIDSYSGESSLVEISAIESSTAVTGGKRAHLELEANKVLLFNDGSATEEFVITAIR